MSKLADSCRHVVCKPKGGNALVSSKFVPVYEYPGKDSLDAAVDTYLVKTVWYKEVTWRNDTPVDQTYHYQYTVELKITKGSDVADAIDLVASLEGLEFYMDGELKVLTSHETTQPVTTSMKLTVPANSTLHLYQRRYTFEINMFFVITLGEDYYVNVGSWNGHGIARKECAVVVSSEDFIFTASHWIAQSLALPRLALLSISRGWTALIGRS